MSIKILKPDRYDATYEHAAIVFQKLYQEITNIRIDITETDDCISDLIIIGSDSVNDFLMNEVLDLRIKSLGLRYGTDDYCILTYKKSLG